MEIDTLDTSHIRLTDRPLIVCDVDDVVLQFIGPFQRFLKSEGHRLVPRSFKLHGNIVAADGTALDEKQVSNLIETFFERQEEWQLPSALAAEMLTRLSGVSDIIFLTAMPPVYSDRRRRLLDSFGLRYPLLVSRQPKGPIVKALHEARDLPVVFIDDMVRNLNSVHEHVDGCFLLHLMPQSEIHHFAPAANEGIARASGWDEAAALIDTHFSSMRAGHENPAA